MPTAEEETVTFLKKHFIAVAFTLFTTFVIATLTMMSAMVVTQTKLTYLVDTVNKIQLNVDINTKNRWTREDHKDYAKAKDQEAAERSRQVDSKIMRIEDRILKLEVQSASRNINK